MRYLNGNRLRLTSRGTVTRFPDVSSYDQGILLSEDITAGEENCLDGVTFHFTHRRLELGADFHFFWSDPTNDSVASDVLTLTKTLCDDSARIFFGEILAMDCLETTAVSLYIAILPFARDASGYSSASITITIGGAAGTTNSYEVSVSAVLDPFAGSYTVTEIECRKLAPFELTSADARGQPSV